MYIGKVAEQCAVTTKTIRYYESLGLLGRVERKGQYRIYTAMHIRLIQLVKQAQSIGFSLAEIQAALSTHQGLLPWQMICQMIETKEQDISAKIAELSQQHSQLQQYRQDIQQCLEDNPSCEPPLH